MSSINSTESVAVKDKFQENFVFSFSRYIETNH